MTEQRLEVEGVTAQEEEEEKEEQTIGIEGEIECPRCHDSMILYSDFDRLYYLCNECDFCLDTIKK